MRQFLRYIPVGISNGLVNLGCYLGFLWLFQRLGMSPGRDYLLAQIIAFCLSSLWAFVLSRQFVFTGTRGGWKKSLLRTFLVYGFTGFVLNSALSVLWVDVLNIPKGFITILNDLAGFPINFLLNKYWTFRK